MTGAAPAGKTPAGKTPGREAPATAAEPAAPDPVDERLPVARLVPLAGQHVLAMVAAPVSTAFLTADALRLTPGQTASLLSVTLLLCGAGTLLQSLGPWRIGARLPFVMLPGGAATALFLQVAAEHGPATASGAVILAALLLLAVLPLYARAVRLFPPLVMGVTVLLIGVSMVRVAAGLVTGAPGRPAAPSALALAAVTVGCTLAAYLLLRGVWRQTSILLGMAAGTLVAVATGLGAFAPPGATDAALPRLLPYGAPHFDLLAALPLLIFSLTSLAEATGQTVLNSETVGRTPDPGRDVPRVARADAVASLLAGVFGSAPLVTSSENIGISRLTGVRSRFVTAGAGVLLLGCGLLAPVSRWLAGIPPAVVGGSALVVYAVIAVLGVGMLRRVDLDDRGNAMVAAVALAAGLLPVVSPGLYDGFPGWVRSVLGSGVVAGALTAVVLHGLYRLLTRAREGERP
ncbi:uracil-xanthine permease family protein [Streptomyces lichenis]|uniref:Purine/pyrimidine permease n=1 Tax=Streptomyces lichenis TaxID=2306967 RepID=A0ABT0I911_9ACTN|nr:solute carrier family 23 protein [Streptomyces lichenis]MCK8677800.1 purine/pyrimidine permease [Streptomyces lichenis]